MDALEFEYIFERSDLHRKFETMIYILRIFLILQSGADAGNDYINYFVFMVVLFRRDLDRYAKTQSWSEPPLGGSGSRGPVPTDYSGLPVHDVQRKVIRASADSGPAVSESSVYEDDRRRVYEQRGGSGPGMIDVVGPTQDCFVMTTAGCRWATAKRIAAPEIGRDNTGDYEYPN